jgi:hypothetical protein
MIKKEKDWFKVKKYLHIGMPIVNSDKKWIQNYVNNFRKLESHAFLPLIHRKKKVRKFRKEIAHDSTRSNLRKPGEKIRELYFANHLDSNVYSFFTQLLLKDYEFYIANNSFGDSVTAYRQIPIDKSDPDSKNKCNIDFAKEVFDKIQSYAPEHLAVFILDISSFFDNLDHQILKRNWKEVIGVEETLPKSDYNIFKNITNFSYVEEEEIFHLFKDQIICKSNAGIVIKKAIKSQNLLKEKNAIAFCEKTKEDLNRIKSAGLIKENKYEFKDGIKALKRVKGIPQGSPISSVLANIYMIEFDRIMTEFATSIGGFYQRYSDDMIFICPAKNSEQVKEKFQSEIKKVKLEIHPSKTQEFFFFWDGNKEEYYKKYFNSLSKKLLDEIQFEYLGFQFDGVRIGIKNASIAKYHRKMKRSFRRAVRFSIHNKTKTKGKIFKSRLYKRFTHLGAKRRMIFKRSLSDPKKWLVSHQFDWGNFLTYAQKSSSKMPNNFINSQLKKHWSKFHRQMIISQTKIFEALKPKIR